jgi:hypothetical protein
VCKISSQQKLRLKLNHVASQSAYQRLITSFREQNDEVFYASTSELLMWIITTHDWHLKNGHPKYQHRMENDKNGVLIYGMRHAFNMMKHNMQFMQIHEKTSDLVLPITIGEVPRLIVVWMKAGDILEGDKPRQKQNYIKHLEGKEIFDTFKKVLTFLNKENDEILLG